MTGARRSFHCDPPLINGAGAFDLHAPSARWRADPKAARHLGAYVTKTCTLHPLEGHPEPRIAHWPEGGLVNAVGIANPGIVEALNRWQPLLVALDIPIVVSMHGDAHACGEMVAHIEQSAGWIAAIELNLSCPNVDGTGDVDLEGIISTTRRLTDRPLIAKLAPSIADIGEHARRAEAAGIDLIAATNTTKVEAVDAHGAQLLGRRFGGLSGAPLHELAVRCVAEVATATSLPIIGIGGVTSLTGAQRLLDAGATIVGVGTAACLEPELVPMLAQALAHYGGLGATGQTPAHAGTL